MIPALEPRPKGVRVGAPLQNPLQVSPSPGETLRESNITRRVQQSLMGSHCVEWLCRLEASGVETPKTALLHKIQNSLRDFQLKKYRIPRGAEGVTVVLSP